MTKPTPSPAPASGAETTTYCPERAKMSSDRRWAKHVAAYDNGTMVNTEGDPLRSICGACGVPIARSHRTSAQWHSAVPSPGTPRSRPTPPSDAGTSERETDRSPKPELPVTAVWLRRIGDEVEVWVEIAGDWYLPCSEHFDGPFSHIAESRGIKHWRKMPPLRPAEEASL